MKIGPEQSVQMPMKTVISLIVMVALGTFGFFQIQEKLNQHSTKLEIMEKDLVLNTEFRIKWPRGLLGSLPADSEQFMLIEELYKQMDKVQIRVDGMLHNEVNIKALTKAVEKLQGDVEKLKDKQRDFANGDQ
jgi:uncharacterized protein HemX